VRSPDLGVGSQKLEVRARWMRRSRRRSLRRGDLLRTRTDLEQSHRSHRPSAPARTRRLLPLARLPQSRQPAAIPGWALGVPRRARWMQPPASQASRPSRTPRTLAWGESGRRRTTRSCGTGIPGPPSSPALQRLSSWGPPAQRHLADSTVRVRRLTMRAYICGCAVIRRGYSHRQPMKETSCGSSAYSWCYGW
jgi:hypothetical protein